MRRISPAPDDDDTDLKSFLSPPKHTDSLHAQLFFFRVYIFKNLPFEKGAKNGAVIKTNPDKNRRKFVFIPESPGSQQHSFVDITKTINWLISRRKFVADERGASSQRKPWRRSSSVETVLNENRLRPALVVPPFQPFVTYWTARIERLHPRMLFATREKFRQTFFPPSRKIRCKRVSNVLSVTKKKKTRNRQTRKSLLAKTAVVPLQNVSSTAKRSCTRKALDYTDGRWPCVFPMLRWHVIQRVRQLFDQPSCVAYKHAYFFFVPFRRPHERRTAGHRSILVFNRN